MDIATTLVHAGLDTNVTPKASSVPIYQASTFPQPDPEHFGPYEYARSGNPTREALERAIAALENGAYGLAFASGIASVASTLMLFKPGDHIVACEDIYGGAYRLLASLFARWGLKADFVDFTDPDRIRQAIRPETVALYAETPSNPLLRITDLAAVASLARDRGLVSIVDNTFMTPYLQRPLDLGFDVSLHSATKFLGGHSDLVAGLAVTASKQLGRKLKEIQNAFGAILGPQDCWLALRGIRTLAVRMDAQQKTAGLLAGWLAKRPEVARVHYPGLAGHPGGDVHARQASGAGAVLSFELGSPEAAKSFLRRARLPMLGVSLGGVESILSYPATMSHAAMPPDEREKRGVTDALVRLSVGLESPDDLMDDLDRALGAAE
jgi:cystathionine beta-lyase